MILNYAPVKKPGWLKRIRAVFAFLAPVVLLAILLTAPCFGLWLLCLDQHGLLPTSPDQYWQYLYEGHSAVVDHQNGSTIVYVHDVDCHFYYTVDTAAADAGADRGAQTYVKELIERWEFSSSERDYYAESLRQLTGQDFRFDVQQWRTWIDAHLREVKGGDDVCLRLAAVQPWRPGPYARAAYEAEMLHFWRQPWHLAGLALLVFCPALLVMLRRDLLPQNPPPPMRRSANLL